MVIDPLSHAYVEHLKASPDCMKAYDEGIGGRLRGRVTSDGYEYYCQSCATRFTEE